MPKIPPISDVETALTIYYKRPTLTNKDVVQLFNLSTKSTSTINRLKKMAKDHEDKNGIYRNKQSLVHTCEAYEAWGIDVTDLELRLKKLRKLQLQGNAK